MCFILWFTACAGTTWKRISFIHGQTCFLVVADLPECRTTLAFPFTDCLNLVTANSTWDSVHTFSPQLQDAVYQSVCAGSVSTRKLPAATHAIQWKSDLQWPTKWSTCWESEPVRKRTSDVWSADDATRATGTARTSAPVQQSTPARKFKPNNVSDLRVVNETTQNTPVNCDEGISFLHMPISEHLMEDGFAENVRRGQLFPIWVRSSGDRNADHKKQRLWVK